MRSPGALGELNQTIEDRSSERRVLALQILKEYVSVSISAGGLSQLIMHQRIRDVNY